MESRYRAPRRGVLSHRMGFVSKKGRIWLQKWPGSRMPFSDAGWSVRTVLREHGRVFVPRRGVPDFLARRRYNEDRVYFALLAGSQPKRQFHRGVEHGGNMGRPSLLNDPLIAKFCDAVQLSGSIESAITLSGIGRSTYYRCRGKVRAGGGNKLQRRFFQVVDKTEGQIKMMREQQLTKHFEKNWRLIAWWLARKYRDEYGRRRPAPLPDPGTGEAERVVDRIVWIEDPQPLAAPAAPAPAAPAASSQPKRQSHRSAEHGGKMGRPSLLNDQLIAEFCDALRVSGSIESAIIMSGIGRSTYYRLKGKVRESGGNEQQRRFFQAVHKAESQIKMMREHQLSKHFEKDWRAIAWWLERKCPNED